MRHMTTDYRNIMIARVLRESEVVRYDRRGASGPLQLERRGNERPPFRILPRRGLVEHQELRARGERGCDRQAALQLGREIARMLVLACAQADYRERLSRMREGK